MDIRRLLRAILQFRDLRDWGQFHTPKDLAAAVSIETSELQELFLWKTEPQIADLVKSAKGKNRLAEEVGDVLIYLLLFSHEVGIDAVQAAHRKLVANAKKYPVNLSKGKATKYTELQTSEALESEADGDAARRDESTVARQQYLFPPDPPLVH